MGGNLENQQVHDNRLKERFELEIDGHTAVAEYHLTPGTITFTHTIVPQALEGRGIGSRLATVALDSARTQGLHVVPQCAFIRGYIERHPEYQDLVQQPHERSS